MTEITCPHCQQPRWTFVPTDDAIHIVPPTDRVVKTRQGQYLRIRVLLTGTQSQLVGDLSSEFVNVKLSVAECDVTGDVVRDLNHAHVIFDAEIYSIRLKALNVDVSGRALIGFDGVLGVRIASLLDRAEDAAAARQQVLNRFQFERPSATQ